MLLITGCNQSNEANNNAYDVNFKEVKPEELKNDSLEEWYNNFYKEEGVHIKDGGEEGKYVLLSAGRKPTGGYFIEVSKVRKRDNTITIEAIVNSPGENEAVTQAITYPHKVLFVEAEDKNKIRADWKNIKRE